MVNVSSLLSLIHYLKGLNTIRIILKKTVQVLLFLFHPKCVCNSLPKIIMHDIPLNTYETNRTETSPPKKKKRKKKKKKRLARQQEGVRPDCKLCYKQQPKNPEENAASQGTDTDGNDNYNADDSTDDDDTISIIVTV